MKLKRIHIDSELMVLFIFVFIKLLIHLGTNTFAGYGIFRDEYYYLACSQHLDLGYVDQPPLSIYILALNSILFGKSLFAIRLIPAVAGALTVLFTGIMVRKLGGGRFAIGVACLSLIVAPVILAMNNFYSMNCLDILLWALAAYLLIRMVKEDNPRLWILLGLVIGFGLLNKISMGFFALGLFIAIMVTKQRKDLTTPWPYVGAGLAVILFLPYIIWNVSNDMAHLEFIRNTSNVKYGSLTPIDFISGQLLMIHPVTLPVWLSGLYFYFINKEGKVFRMLGIIYVTVFLIFIVNGHSKAEYMSPAYAMLFAAGAVQVEKIIDRRFFKRLKYTLPVIILLGGIVTSPLVLPYLPVESFIKYTKAIGFAPQSSEAKELAQLPQHYADMFGWENMAHMVSRVYVSLPPEEKPHTVVYAHNYGEAGAIEYYSYKFELPPVLSPHNSYWIWGWDEIKKNYQTFIIIGGRLEDHLFSLEKVEEAGFIKCRYCMPYENNLPIFIGRGLKRSLEEIWISNKNYN
jgi:hypothetical protein